MSNENLDQGQTEVAQPTTDTVENISVPRDIVPQVAVLPNPHGTPNEQRVFNLTIELHAEKSRKKEVMASFRENIQRIEAEIKAVLAENN